MPHRGHLLNGNHIEDTRSYNIKFTSYSKLIAYNHYDMFFLSAAIVGQKWYFNTGHGGHLG